MSADHPPEQLTRAQVLRMEPRLRLTQTGDCAGMIDGQHALFTTKSGNLARVRVLALDAEKGHALAQEIANKFRIPVQVLADNKIETKTPQAQP